MRTITIKNNKIKELIEKKGVIVSEGRKINTEKEKLETELNKCGLQINKINDKLIPMVKDLKIDLGEFEEIESVTIEKGELVMTIFDKVEEFTNQLRKEQNKTVEK